MIIEDDIELQETISSQLTELGYHVIDGGDGTVSIEILKAIGKIDYLLTDVILPGGHRGTEIAAEALAHDAEIKIIIMTGYADTDVLHNQNLDANTPILFKPFDMQELAATFRTASTQNRQKQ